MITGCPSNGRSDVRVNCIGRLTGTTAVSTAAAGSHLLDRPMTTKHTEKTPLGKRSPAKDNASEVLGDRHCISVIVSTSCTR